MALMPTNWAGFNSGSVPLGTYPGYQPQYSYNMNVQSQPPANWPGGQPPWSQYWSTPEAAYGQYDPSGGWINPIGTGTSYNDYPIGWGSQRPPDWDLGGTGVWDQTWGSNQGGGSGGGQGAPQQDFLQRAGLPSIAELFRQAQESKIAANEANEGRYAEMLDLMRGGWAQAQGMGQDLMQSVLGGYDRWRDDADQRYGARSQRILGGLENSMAQLMEDTQEKGDHAKLAALEGAKLRGMSGSTIMPQLKVEGDEATRDSVNRVKEAYQKMLAGFDASLSSEELNARNSITGAGLGTQANMGTNYMDRLQNWITGLTDVIGSRHDVDDFDMGQLMNLALMAGQMGYGEQPFFNGQIPGGGGGGMPVQPQPPVYGLPNPPMVPSYPPGRPRPVEGPPKEGPGKPAPNKGGGGGFPVGPKPEGPYGWAWSETEGWFPINAEGKRIANWEKFGWKPPNLNAGVREEDVGNSWRNPNPDWGWTPEEDWGWPYNQGIQAGEWSPEAMSNLTPAEAYAMLIGGWTP